MNEPPLSSAPETSAPALDELVEILAQDRGTKGDAEAAARLILDGREGQGFSDLIWNLTHLRYEPAEARKHWEAVLSHKYVISRKLGRNVGIRVAALDYFSNFLQELARPRIVDPVILERLYADATMDPLTGLANRRHYRQRLADEIHRSRRYRNPLALLVFDLDDFKKWNDTKGHAAGDELLMRTAGIIRDCLRDSDFAARWGGEEFVVLLPETSKRKAFVVADRIRARVERSFAAEKVTITGGMAAFPADGEDEEALFLFADRALYRAKSEGKNRVAMAPSERRAYPRLDETLRVRITPLDEERPVETETRNLGAGGIAFLHDRPIEITKMIRGDLELGEDKISFVGHVARVEEIGRGKFEIGLQFMEIDEKAQDLLLEYTA